MGMTDRHKKPGGFRKLVNSIETTPPEKREKILESMRREDPDFVAEVEKSVFKFEEFAQISDLIICEIVGAFAKEMRTLALALYHCTNEPLVQKFMKNMQGPEQFQFRENNESLKDIKERERTAAQYRIVAKARELEQQRKFSLKKYSPHYLED